MVVKRVRQVSQARPERAEGTRWYAVGRSLVTGLRALRGRTLAVAAGAVVAVGALTATAFLLFGNGDDRPPIPDSRARHYRDVDACLLTDDKGITLGTTAARVWQGMQDASLRTHARVSYVPVTGEQSVGNTRPFLNSLLQRSCDVVLATGPAQVSAAQEAAPRHRKVGFVLVGGRGAGGANVTVVAAGDGLRDRVAHAVESGVGGQG